MLASSCKRNNTYKNNQIDNCEGAGGLAWLGYRLDMAGIVGSNPTRPIVVKCFGHKLEVKDLERLSRKIR